MAALDPLDLALLTHLDEITLQGRRYATPQEISATIPAPRPGVLRSLMDLRKRDLTDVKVSEGAWQVTGKGRERIQRDTPTPPA